MTNAGKIVGGICTITGFIMIVPIIFLMMSKFITIFQQVQEAEKRKMLVGK
jgi:hypothetical protein